MPYHRYKVYDPRYHYGRATHKLGRRGTILGLLGVTWILQGVSAILQTEPSVYTLLSGHDYARGTAWLVTGAIAVYYARKPQGYDVYGFIALYIMTSFRIIAYGFDFTLWLLPGGFDGNPRGIVGIFSWFTIIIFLLVVSGWEEEKPKEAAPV